MQIPGWAQILALGVTGTVGILGYMGTIHAPIEAVAKLAAANTQQDRQNIIDTAVNNLTRLRDNKAVAQNLLKKDAATKYFLEKQKAAGVAIDESRLKYLQKQVPIQEEEVERIDIEINAAVATIAKLNAPKVD